MTLDRKFSEIKNIHFATLIDPSVIMSDRVCIGEGTIICAGTILTTTCDFKPGLYHWSRCQDF